jgi:glycosyltransferase involved in cell wall biosynthesis
MDVARSYVVITPARNEEAHIERLIESVVAQTVRPRRYVIVSDGSTDRTDEIVQRLADEHDFITFVRAGDEAGAGKNFGSKVLAFNAGYRKLDGLTYDYIGNLDADVSFGPDYFETLMLRFEADPDLGLAGGDIHEIIGGEARARSAAKDSICGAVQLFRRACFEEIGGYRALPRGGIDAAAEIMARMKGWRVQVQQDLPVIAHRPVMTGNKGPLGTRFNKGVQNQYLGYHPLFHLAVCAKHILQPPYVTGGLWMLAGYISSALRGTPHAVSPEVVNYLRREQLARLHLGARPKAARSRHEPALHRPS